MRAGGYSAELPNTGVRLVLELCAKADDVHLDDVVDVRIRHRQRWKI